MADETDIKAEMDLAEAAAWLTTLQGGDRTPAIEAAFKDWLADPGHASAFDRLNDLWEGLPALLPADEAGADRSPRPRLRRNSALAMAASVLLLGGLAVTQLGRDPVYETGVGQQQSLSLEDGSHVALNTDSRLSVDYSAGERRVHLARGEVQFDVAKNPDRPFIVDAGTEEVRAVGTSFVVRRDGDKVSVTLLQGKVEVTDLRPQAKAVRPAMLVPGQRLIAATSAAAAIDRPRLEAVTAWRQGNVIFDDQPLSEAVGELNRYAATPIVLTDPGLGALRISGVFEVQDVAQSAQLIAEIHHLRMIRSPNAIEIRVQ